MPEDYFFILSDDMVFFLSIMASGFCMPVVAGFAMPSGFLSIVILSSFMAGFSVLVAYAIASGAKASRTSPRSHGFVTLENAL